MRRTGRNSSWSRLAPAVLVALLFAAGNARAEVKVGDVRAAMSRSGVVLRDAPKPLAARVRTLVYGTRVTVEEVKNFFARVKLEDGTTGWVRSAEIVEPATLPGGGAGGAVDPASFSTADISAAGRQFDAKTERTFRTMDASMDAAFPKVDEVEKAYAPESVLLTFLKEGWLGAHEELEPLIGPRATVHMIGGNGQLVPAVAAPATSRASRGMATTDLAAVEQLESQPLSPEQEYYLGRSVAAAAIAEHGLDADEGRQALVRKIGAALVRISDRVRPVHGGYHFAVLDDPNPNGISGPGGFVFVTKGAMVLARTEDEVAAIVAHEIAHVSLRHGEAVMRQTREWQEEVAKMRAIADAELAAAARKAAECGLCAEFAKLMGGSARRFVKTLDKEGYGKEFELEADWEGSIYLCEVGYRSSALAEYLAILPNREITQWTTHPPSVERIDSLRPLLIRHCFPEEEVQAGVDARTARYHTLMARK
jgi:hypothetical protein